MPLTKKEDTMIIISREAEKQLLVANAVHCLPSLP